MDKFAEDAFRDAMEMQAKDEFKAWCKFSEEDYMAAYLTIVAQIGLEKVNALCNAANRIGQGDTLAEYTHRLMMMAFHRGYKARMEEE